MDFVDNNIQKVQVQPKDQVYARNEDIKVYGKLVSMSTENVVADSEQIWDEALKKNQSDINSATQSKFGEYLPLTGGDISGDLDVYGSVGLDGPLTLGDSLRIEENNFAFEGENNESLTINSNGLTYAFSENSSDGFNVVDGDARLNSLSVISKNDEEKYISHIRPGGLTINNGDNTARFTSTSVELQGGNETHITANKIITDKILMQKNEQELLYNISIDPSGIIMNQGGSESHQTIIMQSGITTDGYFRLKNGTDQDVLLGDGSTTDRLIKDVTAGAIQSEYNFNFITTGNVNKFVTIKAATSTTAGVMTAADKTKLDDVPNIYAEKSNTISNITVGNRPNKRGLYIAIDYADKTNPGTTVNIPNVTIASDGCMSYEDKNKLDNIENTYLPLSGGTLTGALRLNDINSDGNGLDINNVNGIQSVDQDKVSTPEVWTTNGNSIPLNIANGIAKLDQNGNIPLKNLGNIDTQIALVVDKLPTIDIKTNKIYLVRKSETGEDNAYIEYVYINNSWEKFGEYTPSIDLSEYSLKSKTVSSAIFTTSYGGPYLQLNNANGSKSLVPVPQATGPGVSDTGHQHDGQDGFMSIYDKVKLDGIDVSANNYILRKATSSDLGGIKIGFLTTSSSKDYPVKLDSGDNAYVHVPWTDTQTDISNCVKTDQSSTINADVTVNGKISSTDANIVIDSGKLELHEGSYGINFISGEDSSYISKTNGKSNEYFATDGSIQTIPNSYLPLSGGTVTGGITVDGAINTKSNITTDGTVTAKGFVSKTEKNPHEVWACNGNSINLRTLIAAAAVYVHGSIVESIAESINLTVTIEDPDAIIFNKATGSFVAKQGNGYYRYWSATDSLLISDSDRYGFFTSKRGVIPYHKQLYTFANDNVNVYIADNTGSVPILDVF